MDTKGKSAAPLLLALSRLALFAASFLATGQRWGMLGTVGLLPLLATSGIMYRINTQARSEGWTGSLLINALIVTFFTAIPIAVATASAMLTRGELWGIALGALWLAWFVTASGRR